MENQLKTSPKDVFLHLLSIIALYISVGSFLVLIFQYVNVFFPDQLTDGYYALQSAYSTIRWSIASLVIIFPVYFWTMWFLDRGYQKMPETRDFRLRKWLIYFTLFLAALIIIGDLVTLIYNLLSGELTVRFILKILTVLLTVGSVFFYYLWDVRK
jgi:uncharacterized membrane protein